MNKNRILFSDKAGNLFRLFGVCLFLIFGAAKGWAQDYYLYSQEDVNAFPQDITAITGGLIISGASISDLGPLQNLESIGKSLVIGNCPALTNLAGLSALKSVGGGLTIENCDALTNLDVLSSLTAVGYVYVINNSALTNLGGLSSLTSTGNIYCVNNVALTNLGNFPALKSLDNLVVYATAITNLDGLSSVTSVKWDIIIDNNIALTNLDGLYGLTTVRNIRITNNPSLADCCGIHDLINTPGATSGDIFISGNKTGCEIVSAINAYCFSDIDSDGIADTADNCPTVANPAQQDADCDGVGNVCDVCPGGDDSVDNNGDGRPDCKYPPTLDKVLPAWKCSSKKVYICHKSGSNAKTLCISYADLGDHLAHGDYLGPCGNASCDAPFSGNEQSSEHSSTEGQVLYANPELSQAWLDRTAEKPMLYPNPAQGETWIDLHAWEGRPCTIRLMDVHAGLLREIKVDEAGHESIRLDVSGLASGLYFVQVQTTGEAQMLKMVVERN